MKTYSFAKISVMGMPTRLDVGNKYMFGGVSRIVNVSGQKYPDDVRAALVERGIQIYEFPLVEEGPDMGIENILKAVAVLAEADRAGEKVIVHCFCGNNRSRTVVETYYFAKTGMQLDDEYKSYPNHLIYNCSEGHLPSLKYLFEAGKRALLLDGEGD